MKKLDYPYYFYISGGNYFARFLERNPEFDTREFIEYAIGHNRADRDSGELQDVAKHEVLRLAYEWEERMYRFPNCYGDPKDRIPKKREHTCNPEPEDAGPDPRCPACVEKP